MYSRVNREHFKRNARDAINGYSGKWDVQEAKDKVFPLGIIPFEKCHKITRRCSQCITSREQIYVFVMELLESEPLENILTVLDAVGLKTIADEICRPLDRQVNRIDLPHSRHLQTFYFHLKENIDNNNFIDKRAYLESLSNSLKASFERFHNENDLTKASGRFAVVTWLRIQHCNRNTNLIRAVLLDMLDRWPNGIDKSLCEIFFHSKMAIADIMDGEIEPAIKRCRTAKHLSVPYYDPLTKSLISHDSRYTHQRVFELNRSEENRHLILVESENGLDFLSSDSTGCDLFNTLMKRMFLLYLAQYRLKIQNDLNTEAYDNISDSDLKAAKNAMFCFDLTLKPNENLYQKIERIYLLYKARHQARKGEFQKSEDTLQHMQELNSQENETNVRFTEDDKRIYDSTVQFTEKFLSAEILDPRRSMIYMVCRARICEKDGEFGMSEFLLSRAFELAEEGAHYKNEMLNIRKFINRLHTRSDNEPMHIQL